MRPVNDSSGTQGRGCQHTSQELRDAEQQGNPSEVLQPRLLIHPLPTPSRSVYLLHPFLILTNKSQTLPAGREDDRFRPARSGRVEGGPNVLAFAGTERGVERVRLGVGLEPERRKFRLKRVGDPGTVKSSEVSGLDDLWAFRGGGVWTHVEKEAPSDAQDVNLSRYLSAARTESQS